MEQYTPLPPEKIRVTMTQEALFDFFLYHAYSKLSGFLQNLLGFAVFFLGVFSYVTGRTNGIGCFFYILAAVCFLGYTPFLLKRKGRRPEPSGKRMFTVIPWT